MRPRFHMSRWLIAGLIAGGIALAACSSGADSDSAGSARLQSGGDDGEGAANQYDADKVASGPVGATAPEQSAPASLPSQLDRKIIRVATVSLRTEEVSRAYEDVSNIAALAGGFVSSSSFGNDGDRQRASVTIRVPGDTYEATLAKLRKLGDVTNEDASASDVTEQVTDLEARLRNLKATEAQYLDFMTRARDINEVLTVQDRLNATRAEIEQTQGRLDLLAHQTDLATITVHLDPPLAAKTETRSGGASNPLEVAQEAFGASLVVLLGAATVIVAVGAFSWWLPPLFALGVYIVRRQSRLARGRQAPPTA